MAPRRALARSFLVGLLATTGCCTSGVPASARIYTEASSREAAVNAMFSPFAAAGGPGVAVSIYQRGKLLYSHGFGIADLESGQVITPETPFHVASVSKQFTAFAIALLARDGKLDLDADIRRYLPEVPDFGQVITVRQLLMHTSGLRDQWSLFELTGRPLDNVLHQQQVMNLVSRQRALNFVPGTEHMYCNTGFTLLAEIVRVVSGESLRQFAEDRIFRPLGMTHSFFYDDVTELVPGRAQSYQHGDGINPWHRSLLNYDTYGATSLFTTAADLAKWAGNFAHPVVGDAALIREISAGGALRDGTLISYAFGLEHSRLGGRRTISHDGADAGFRAIFVYYPDDDFAVAITANSNYDPGVEGHDLDLEAKVKTIADLFLGKRSDGLSPIDPRANPAPLAGTYAAPNSDNPSLRLIVSDGVLYRDYGGGTHIKLVQRRDGSFDKGDPRVASYHAFTDSNGEVVTIQRDVPDHAQHIRYTRVAPFTLARADLSAFAGDYRSDELDARYTLFVDSDHLSARSLWTLAPIALTPVSRDRFEASPSFFNVVAFDRDEKGVITGFRVSGSRIRNIVFRRVAVSQ